MFTPAEAARCAQSTQTLLLLQRLHSYLIFVISFTQAGFLNLKFYTQKRKKKTPKNLKNVPEKVYYMPFLRSIWKILHLTGYFYTGTARGARNNYQVWLHCTSPFLQSLDTSVSQSHIRHTPTFPVPCSHPTRRHGSRSQTIEGKCVCVYISIH